MTVLAVYCVLFQLFHDNNLRTNHRHHLSAAQIPGRTVLTPSGPAGSSQLYTDVNMPIFCEDEEPQTSDSKYPHIAPIPIQSPPDMEPCISRRLSEESIRTELCEGPIPDSPPRPVSPQEAVSRPVKDRAELIERLKRGESPTWVPNRHVGSLSTNPDGEDCFAD